MPEQPIINTFLILILSVVIMGGMFFALKKYIIKHKSLSNSAYVKIISKQPLSTKANLFVVEIESRRFLIGVAEKNISLISELTANKEENNIKTKPDLPQNTNEVSGLSFKDFLKSTISKS